MRLCVEIDTLAAANFHSQVLEPTRIWIQPSIIKLARKHTHTHTSTTWHRAGAASLNESSRKCPGNSSPNLVSALCEQKGLSKIRYNLSKIREKNVPRRLRVRW